MEKVVKSGVEEANSSSEPTVGSQMVPDLETVYDSVRRLENSQEKISSRNTFCSNYYDDLHVDIRRRHVPCFEWSEAPQPSVADRIPGYIELHMVKLYSVCTRDKNPMLQI